MAAAAIGLPSHPYCAKPQVPKGKLATVSSCRAGVETGRKVNFYRVLSLESEKASAQEIKRAYRALARRFHPDVCPPERREACAQVLVEVNRAYEALSDPALRRRHDAELGVEGAGRGDGRREFSRETWERQLAELGRRSALRLQRRGRVPWW